MAQNSTKWTLGKDFFTRGAHHESIKDLWETKWKFAALKSVYPFHDGKFEDFEQVFAQLIESNINDAYSDAYTEAFFPTCRNLSNEVDIAIVTKDFATASNLYFRIAALYRISRFPIINSETKRIAFEYQKIAYMKAVNSWIDPIREVQIPYIAASGSNRVGFPIYVRVPSTASSNKPVPVVILITGLDGYRPDNTQRSHEFLKRGWASVIVEIPGTADSAADPRDVMSPDRVWDRVFEWMDQQHTFDINRVVAWGLSMGGYYAVRIAHTHKARLRGVIAQGAGVHHFFDREWLDKVDDHEYPFDINPAFAQKFGYDCVEKFKEQSQKKFSLLETGILHRSSTQLLLINGTHDGLMPVEDSILCLKYGNPKHAR
ncbi:hypothetical protein B7463_g8519, partial [Scytalidium lignicola]